MSLDDKIGLSKIVKIAQISYNKRISSLSEIVTQEFETLLNIAQGAAFGLIDNYGTDNKDIPFKKRPYAKIIKEYKNYQNGEEVATEKTKNILKDLIIKDEQTYHNLIGYAMFEKDPKENNHFNELFVCKLNSKYKNIGEKLICVVFKKQTTTLIMEDGEQYDCDFSSFVVDFFGSNLSDVQPLFLKLKQHFNNNKISHLQLQEKISTFCSDVQKKIDEDYSLVYGAVMFCDFLGWKGLWKNSEESDALKKANSLVEKIRTAFQDFTTKRVPLNKYLHISELISISDTIALMMPKVNGLQNEDIFELFADIGQYILEESILIYPLRGAFTVGQFNYTNNIMIGPAIDEAASWHEMADWIGIILAPTAQFEYESSKQLEKIIKYTIPLKNYRGQLNYCIRWNEPENAIIEMVHRNKSLIPEIASKYINTAEFLKKTSSSKGGKNE